MRRVVIGILLIPGALGAAWLTGHGNELAVAAPMRDQAASARLTRMFEGRFAAQPEPTPEGALDAIDRVSCRVSAPELGAQALYVEEGYRHGSRGPFSQRLYVFDGRSREQARMREYTFVDPSSLRGLCEHPGRVTLSPAEVTERLGCAIDLRWKGDHFEGVTRGHECRSVLNGAHHTKRTLDVRDGALTLREQGVDTHGDVVWGVGAMPLRFDRVRE